MLLAFFKKKTFIFFFNNFKLLKQRIKKKFLVFKKFFVIFFKLVGVGYKTLCSSSNVFGFFLYVGFSHWFFIKVFKKNLFLFFSKEFNVVKCISTNLNTIINFCSFVAMFKKASNYKKKGIFIFTKKYFKQKIIFKKLVKKK